MNKCQICSRETNAQVCAECATELRMASRFLWQLILVGTALIMTALTGVLGHWSPLVTCPMAGLGVFVILDGIRARRGVKARLRGAGPK